MAPVAPPDESKTGAAAAHSPSIVSLTSVAIPEERICFNWSVGAAWCPAQSAGTGRDHDAHLRHLTRAVGLWLVHHDHNLAEEQHSGALRPDQQGPLLRLIGDCGTGKSHLLIALGAAAAEHPYRFRYTLATRLVNELVEAADKQLTKTINRYGAPFAAWGLGYLELDKRGAELLFQVLTEREEKNTIANREQ
jgi:hypothetical protein